MSCVARRGEAVMVRGLGSPRLRMERGWTWKVEDERNKVKVRARMLSKRQDLEPVRRSTWAEAGSPGLANSAFER